MNVLVTGGGGYIGSHACVELLMAGHNVVVIDNFSNSSPAVFDRIERICDRRPHVYREDIRNGTGLKEIFLAHSIEAVIHFAGLKSVGESVEQPLRYYDNNIGGSLVLLEAMKNSGVRTLVFSSSATVYGNPSSVPIAVDSPLSATNPYGRTKLMIESILQDMVAAESLSSVALLRYFNPVGAHKSGLIGEDPSGTPSNLMPYISQVAIGMHKELKIFGGDYPTPDGTGVRDFIHVVDLAQGHIAALDWLQHHQGVHTFNLGTGVGTSVLNMVRSYEAVCGKPIPYQIVERRSGDVAECYADVSLSEQVLGWKAQLSLVEMCRDSWTWQSSNPHGYRDQSSTCMLEERA